MNLKKRGLLLREQLITRKVKKKREKKTLMRLLRERGNNEFLTVTCFDKLKGDEK